METQLELFDVGPRRGESVVVIPARMESNRLPGKPLIDICGKPLIVRAWESAVAWCGADNVFVVTDSFIIRDALLGWEECNVIYDQTAHPNGSRRIFAVLDRLPESDIVINLQCDEPQIRPEDFDALLAVMYPNSIGTLACDIGETVDPNSVYAIMGTNDHVAVYFTRTPIEYALLHVGVYGFWRDNITDDLLSCPRSRLAEAEDLEQLAWLDGGSLPIRLAKIDHQPISVNATHDVYRLRKTLSDEPK